MAQNKVMKLWTAIVTAFLALCTALGLVTPTATAAVPQTEATRNCAAPAALPAVQPLPWSRDLALPPTMKQRIGAEAHGSSPSCRHRPTTDAAAVTGLATLDALDALDALDSAHRATKTEDDTEVDPAAPPLRADSTGLIPPD